MKKHTFLYMALPLLFLVSIVSALTMSIDVITEFPNGDTFTSTIPLDAGPYTVTLGAGGILSFGNFTTTIIPGNFTITLPATSFTSTIPAVTSTIPGDWPRIWAIPFGDSALTVTLRPSDGNTVPEPSSMLLMLTGSIILIGFALKKRIFNP